MELLFYKISGSSQLPKKCINKAYLVSDNWDDFHFKTFFALFVFDENSQKIDVGSLKIGYVGQLEGGKTGDKIPSQFQSLDEKFFSIGQDVEYYQNIKTKLSSGLAHLLLTGLSDLANNIDKLESVKDEKVLKTSLLRNVSLSVIYGQYKRVLDGGVVLTEFHFSYIKEQTKINAGIRLDFHVEPSSKPSTNIHIVIGRNGVGKTTLLNNMVRTIVRRDEASSGSFYEIPYLFPSTIFDTNEPIDEKYFSSVVAVSFSAFDPFVPPQDQPDKSKGTCFFYIVLKKNAKGDVIPQSQHKEHADLCEDFLKSIRLCLKLKKKEELWLNTIKKLESDSNFEDINFSELVDVSDHSSFDSIVESKFSSLSSGHAIVLLIITRLVETVEEKTLVLIDEPESHLHPPLLSAFTRALSDLLINRNGVAIIATHSPVVLQEVPRSCVWKLRRNRSEGSADRPENETFGENVGVLTREVFGLEVQKSGFHNLLIDSVKSGKNFDETLEEYDQQLGFEGRTILRALIHSRNKEEE